MSDPLMLSPDPRQASRTPMEVLHRLIGRGDRFIVIGLCEGEPLIAEGAPKDTFDAAVRDIATGDIALGGTLAVLRINLADGEAEIVPGGRLARAVADYVTSRCDAPHDLWPCPFLDENYPAWRDDYEQDWNAEMAGMADAGFYARYGT